MHTVWWLIKKSRPMLWQALKKVLMALMIYNDEAVCVIIIHIVNKSYFNRFLENRNQCHLWMDILARQLM